MSILRVVSRPVPVTLGGRPLLAGPLTVGDLAELEAWTRARHPSPYDAAADRLEAGPRDREWKQLLWDTIDAQERHDEAPAGDLDSAEGLVRQLWLCLRRHDPGLAEAEVETLVLAALVSDEPGAWAEVRRILRIGWAVAPMVAMREMVQGPGPGVGGETDWPGLFRIYMERFGGPASAFADLTLDQLRALGEGDGEDGGGEGTMIHALEVSRRTVEFWAEIRPEMAEAAANWPEPRSAPAEPWFLASAE